VADIAPSIASVYKASLKIRGMLYLVASQSGRSPDLIASVQQARADGALVVALVNDTDSPVASLADLCLPLLAGPEISVAATKSFIAILSAVAQLVAAWSEDAALQAALQTLPEGLEAARAQDWAAAAPALGAAQDVLVIGRGVGVGIAQEAALKLKETSSLHAEAFSAAELRHGPMAILRPGLPVVVFSQDDETRPGVQALVADLRAKGARVFAAETAPAETGSVAADRLPVPAAHPALAPLLMVQSFYGLANLVALARGHDPDRPQYLQKVTHTY
jgi:glucosamine--fructose-6-phosphate aminotransferase (isomerizing)